MIETSSRYKGSKDGRTDGQTDRPMVGQLGGLAVFWAGG